VQELEHVATHAQEDPLYCDIEMTNEVGTKRKKDLNPLVLLFIYFC
jgi:hypothetical protein